ncbi:hypothetical protein [Saccharolobus solfataricus]|uniref:Uncharacterized protein n=2 Tax=Saccharolobus solfataricus TaxID=2287 RepID=A0A157T1N5_SACSO|nr:hypothetical protein [Saccharolobus solfataricus]QPG48874.1 hypothetical protein HFC64_01980 [Saccharolobus solfataricus]SAI85150.1 uncharacterised protein [Saccharolobus solfataricus]
MVLGWGFFVPIYFATRGRRIRSVSIKIADAIDMYYKGLITKDQLIQIIDMYRDVERSI